MKNLLKASIITGTAFLINLIFNTIRAKIVAVFLGPSGVAIMAQLGGFTTLVITLCSLGLTTAIVRYVAEYKAAGRHQDLKTLIGTVAVVVSVVSIIVTLLMLLLIPLVSQIIFGKEIFLLLIALSILNIPISVITNLAVSLLQGLKEIKLDAIFSVFATVFSGILLIVLLIPFGVTGAVVASLVANYVTSAIFFVFVFRSLNKHLGSSLKYLRFKGYRSYLRINSLRPLTGIAFASLIGGGITNFADILIRSNLIQVFGLVAAGSIQPALTFSAQYTGLLGGAISTYAVPRLSELSNTDRPLFQKEYNDYIRLMLLVVTPFAILVAIGASFLVPLLYSDRFSASIPLVPLQSVADVIEFAFIGMAGAFLPMGRGKILLGLGIMIPFLYYGAYLALVPTLGLKAIPVASGAGWLIAAGVSYIILRRSLKLQIRRKNFWLMANSVIATVAVALAVNKLPGVAGVIASLTALVAWGLINISADERAMIAALVKKRFGKS